MTYLLEFANKYGKSCEGKDSYKEERNGEF